MPQHDDLTGKRIVICEDEGITVMQLERALTRAGLLVVGKSGNGKDCVAVVLRERPDIVLMDIVMPGQNGFQLMRSINRTPEYAGIPIIICTSKNLETDRVWGMRQGARDYITKPVDAAELMVKIKALG